jgi:hypothetical protein
VKPTKQSLADLQAAEATEASDDEGSGEPGSSANEESSGEDEGDHAAQEGSAGEDAARESNDEDHRTASQRSSGGKDGEAEDRSDEDEEKDGFRAEGKGAGVVRGDLSASTSNSEGGGEGNDVARSGRAAHPSDFDRGEKRIGAMEAATGGKGLGEGSALSRAPYMNGFSESPLPSSYDELSQLLRGCSGPQVVDVLQRIRACHAEALTAQSGVHLQRLFGQVMQYFSEVAGARPPRWELLEALEPLLRTMTAEVPWYAATFVRTRLQAIHQHFDECMASPKCVSWDYLWIRHSSSTPRCFLGSRYFMQGIQK